jgi:hypothetical protein
MTLSRAAVLVGGFVLGCAAGPAVSSLVVPPANAQGTQRWSHFCVSEWGAEDVTKVAQHVGAQGWEMAGAAATPNRAIWCFKRPM